MFTWGANSELKSDTSGKVFKLTHKYSVDHSAEYVVIFMQSFLVGQFSKVE